jgi:hypothetical protein
MVENAKYLTQQQNARKWHMCFHFADLGFPFHSVHTGVERVKTVDIRKL